jgi:tRNA threonylcarbamoyladenosine biosynthesis protein TsaE
LTTSSHDSDSVAATQRVARDLAITLIGGECIALHGDLGAGKTQFVRGLLTALGGNPRAVSSPTFVLLNVYDTPSPKIQKIYHLDAYRVGGADDFEAIGFTELLDQQNAIVVVEWADRVVSLLPSQRIDVTITPTGLTNRRIEIVHTSSNSSGSGDRLSVETPAPTINRTNDATSDTTPH